MRYLITMLDFSGRAVWERTEDIDAGTLIARMRAHEIRGCRRIEAYPTGRVRG